MNSGEGNAPEGQEEMSRLRILQREAAKTLREEYFEHGMDSRGNFIWVTLFELLLDDAREREAELERKFHTSWQDSKEYLSKLDNFIDNLKDFSKSKIACDEEIKRRKEDVKKDIEGLEKKLEEKKKLLGLLGRNLQGLQRVKKDLWRLRETPEFIILSNWVRATCDKCIEIENEIMEIKLRISRKNEDVLEFLGLGHDIFSKFSVEELKKMPPFKTDAELAASSMLSLM